MARTVTVLPATINRETSAPIGSMAKRKVAAYARVSTDHEEQQSSYEAQCDYYTNYIRKRDDWEFAGIYSDEGVTGTSTKKREGFTRMVDDALAGKIDLIITKSVSRFARNTVDSLTTIRKLKEHGTEVFFEKESIWTFDSKGEMLLTILSSLSQEESRSISENVKWGQRKKFSDGRFSMCYGRFLGYDKGMVINEEQAKTIVFIYSEFIMGLSPKAIAKKLTELGYETPGGQKKWYEGTVRSILKNEKYKGCALLQKTYTPDFLTKKSVKNDGKVPQFFVEDSHPAIIDPDQFELVQDIFEERAREPKHSGATIFSGKIRCGCCGGWYGSKVWHSNDKYRRIIWQCNAKFKDKTRCQTPHMTEDEIKVAFVRLVNRISADRDFYITELTAIRDRVSDTSELEREKRLLDQQLAVDAKAVNDLIAENARKAQNQAEYREREAALVSRYEETEAKRDAVADQISQRMVRRRKLERFIEAVKALPELYTEFDKAQWSGLVDSMTVHSKDKITFTLTSGMEIEA
ncbi:MAG: recombinase family protein [Oscillospiraceae bacterium]|nr:recombinase family protein [Oscillospiraceae bacterium]